MILYVGTSGYSYKEWKGSFYPKDLPAAGMLRFYSGRFGTVEINSSFYRMPKASVLGSWAAEVPADFRFVLKAPQRITHFRRLKNCRAVVADFLNVAAALKKRRGPLLFQLPPNMKKDVPRLRDFLKLLPRGGRGGAAARTVFEFRHPTWFDDEVFDLLRERRVALCIAETEGDLRVPFVATTDWGYLRMRMGGYSTAELKSWVKRVREQDWRDAYVFFKHEDEGKGPKFARRFLELAS